MGTIIVVANSKGGTGKTTISRELAYQLSEENTVTAIDFDPQASLTRSFREVEPTAYISDCLRQRGAIKASDARTTISPTLSLIAGDPESQAIDLFWALNKEQAKRFSPLIKGLSQDVDFVVIDTVGTASHLTKGALLGADMLIVPVRPEGYDIDALSLFEARIKEVQEERAQPLQKIGLVLFGYADYYDPHAQVKAQLETHCKQMGFRMLQPIGHSKQVGAAALAGGRVGEWSRSSPRAVEFTQLAKEIRTWAKR